MKFGTFVPYMYRFVIIVKYLTKFFKLEWNLGIKLTLRFFFLSVYFIALNKQFLPKALYIFGRLFTMEPKYTYTKISLMIIIDHLSIYSRPSLSRPRLSRITAYIEVKLWSLF